MTLQQLERMMQDIILMHVQSFMTIYTMEWNGCMLILMNGSWEGIDGSESTSVAVRGPNLLGAEMAIRFSN